MTSPEILIPFSLPPAEHTKDLVKLLTSECGTDGLAMLLSRYQTLLRKQFDDFSPQLPHEIWLDTQLKARKYSLLQHFAHSLHVNLSSGYWFVVNPVHLALARHHFVLTDYRQLALSNQDAILLYQKAKSLCEESGLELIFGNATTWFLRANDWSDFVTSSPDAACGHNIDIWLPKGEKEFAWRKCQNEIQMEYFIHPVNQQREARGEPVINGLWLWTGTELASDFVSTNNDAIISSSNAKDFFLTTPPLTLVDPLSSAALSDDWQTWAQLMIELEHSWFKPICVALKERKLDQIKLHLSNGTTLLSVQTNRYALRKFWCTPNFKNLLPST